METTMAADAAADVRYLANDGNDAADGKTPATAWRTVEKLNAALPPGATALLKSGDVFYGSFSVTGGVDAEHPTVIAAYGDGPKPVVSATKNLRCDPGIWEPVSRLSLTDFIWRTHLLTPSNYTGIVSDDANPGFLLVDGEVKPWRRYCHHDVNRDWDFAGEDGWLYVYCTSNPARVAKEIRVAVNVHVMWLASNTSVRGLSVKATGAHGIVAGWGTPAEHIRIADCDFENIGGSELPNFSATTRARYGNGVEFGSNCRDALIERCTFRGVYDVAFTMQGYPKTSWSDIHMRDCVVRDSTQAFEVWCRGAPEGVGFERCSFTGNHTCNVGGGWGALTRPNRHAATPLLVYFMETDTVDITVCGNRFENAPLGILYKSGGIDTLPSGYRIFGNEVIGG